MSTSNSIKLNGPDCFKHRILLSLLTGKTIVISNIRLTSDINEGLNDAESCLLDLVIKLTSGTNLNISKTKTKLDLKPGSLIGGEITHDCVNTCSISYYLDFLIAVAPFCKKPIKATLNGVTNDQVDPSVDEIRYGALPVLKRFLGDIEGKVDIKVTSKGFKPDGGGQVIFTCPIVKELKSINLTDPGLIKKVRGIATAVRVSPQMANRMIETSKGILLDYLQDIYINSDHQKGKSSVKSPGFSITLSAETTNGCFYVSSASSNEKGSGFGPSLPEDVATEATERLLNEISRGGCVDSKFQSLAFLFMVFNSNDVSKLKLGLPPRGSIDFLRHIKQFCGVTFAIDSEEYPLMTTTCLGIGYKNINRPTY